MNGAGSSADRRIVPDTRLRDTLIAVAVGLAVLGCVGYAVLALNRQAGASGGAEGIVVGKEFVARPETQITVGRGGVKSRKIAGEYILRVRVPSENGKIYRVDVDQAVYDSRQAGDHHYFLRQK